MPQDAEYHRQWRLRNPGKAAANMARYRSSPKRPKKKPRDWSNPRFRRAYMLLWRSENRHHVSCYRSSNPDAVCLDEYEKLEAHVASCDLDPSQILMIKEDFMNSQLTQ